MVAKHDVKAAYYSQTELHRSVFWFASVVRPCVAMAYVTRLAWMTMVSTDDSTRLQDFMRVCVGERAVALLAKGCTRLLMRVVSSVSSWKTCLVNDARYVE